GENQVLSPSFVTIFFTSAKPPTTRAPSRENAMGTSALLRLIPSRRATAFPEATWINALLTRAVSPLGEIALEIAAVMSSGWEESSLPVSRSHVARMCPLFHVACPTTPEQNVPSTIPTARLLSGLSRSCETRRPPSFRCRSGKLILRTSLPVAASHNL